MRRFITRLALLSAPFGLLILAMLFAPVNKKFAYEYLKGDFSKASWIYKRIFENPEAVDVAFLGTSHTLNGVNDSLIEAKLNQQLGSRIRISNLSLNQPGANAHFAIFKDLLKTKKPKIAIVEVREVEARFSHFAFPILADTEDMLFPELVPNVYLFRDYMYALQSRYAFYKGLLAKERSPFTVWNFRSFGYQANSKFVTAEELEQKRQQHIKSSPLFYLGEDFREIEFRLGKKYMEKMSKLARENNVELVFLYLPYYNAPVDKPVEFEFYNSMGEIWQAPSEILNNPSYWSDLYHVNDQAATILADWITEKLLEKRHSLVPAGNSQPSQQAINQVKY